jgi:hypothetical protein
MSIKYFNILEIDFEQLSSTFVPVAENKGEIKGSG